MPQSFNFDDFTEAGYREALALAKMNWTFERFGTESQEPHVLWRHDVDLSPNRALRLSELELDSGARATYFFLLHSEFYNCMEFGTRDIMRRIADSGHDIGVHFDATFYPEIGDLDSLERLIKIEAQIIGDLCNKAPVAVSFHNPTADQLARYDQPRLAGLVNAYGSPLRASYRYVSDSNGYWRFHRLHDVLAALEDTRLHVLTHPEWWTPECSSPRARVARAVEGRAARTLREYDAFLEAQGRSNVR